MVTRYDVRNAKEQVLARVLITKEERLDHFVGVIVKIDLTAYNMGLYRTADSKTIVADLVIKLGIQGFHDYVQLEN